MTNRHRTKRKKPNAKGRNEYEPFIQIYRHVPECAAYTSLSGNASKLLIQFTFLFKGTNNGEIYLSVRKAGEFCGFSKGTAQRCINELIEKGFIKVNQKGSFDHKVKHATTYWLTMKANPGKQPTKEYMRWKPEKQKSVPKINLNSIKNYDRVQNLIPYYAVYDTNNWYCDWRKFVFIGAKN